MMYLKLFTEFKKNYYPIGIFDSGYGGLLVLNSIKKILTQTDFIFLGDNLTAPYGELSKSEIKFLTNRGINKLKQFGCSKIIVACNTACTVIDHSDEIVDIINPTIDFVNRLDYNFLGILGTSTTIESKVYQKSLPNSIGLGCKHWARLVETGDFGSENGLKIIQSDLQRLFKMNSQIDTILLACTHYIALKDIISEFYPHVKLVSQDEVMVDFMINSNLVSSKNGIIEYLTTGNSEEFDLETNNLIGLNVKSKTVSL